MKNIIVISGIGILLANMAMADHGGVHVDKVEKVIINKGHTSHEKVMMMKCMTTLKQFASEEEAMDAALTKIDAKCAKYKMDDKKCHHIKKKVAKAIYHCFVAKDFFKEFFGK